MEPSPLLHSVALSVAIAAAAVTLLAVLKDWLTTRLKKANLFEVTLHKDGREVTVRGVDPKDLKSVQQLLRAYQDMAGPEEKVKL